METGKSIYAFIKSAKIDQSAFRLKVEKDKTITDIGYYYGYSPSNYSSVFHKEKNISPVNFRKNIKHIISQIQFFWNVLLMIHLLLMWITAFMIYV